MQDAGSIYLKVVLSIFTNIVRSCSGLVDVIVDIIYICYLFLDRRRAAKKAKRPQQSTETSVLTSPPATPTLKKVFIPY